MSSSSWEKPVEIDLGLIGTRKVSGPFDALIYLTDQWPNRSGARFVRARIACEAALEGRTESEKARRDFVAAAKEAHLLLH